MALFERTFCGNTLGKRVTALTIAAPLWILLSVLALIGGPYAVAAGPKAMPAGQKAATEARVRLLDGFMERRGVAAAMLRDLLTLLPERTWLTEVVYDPGGIKVGGNAATNNALANYLASLEGSSALSDVNLISSARKEGRYAAYEEFLIRAAPRDRKPSKSPGLGSAQPRESATALNQRLQELEAFLPAQKDIAAAMREIQRACQDSGLTLSKFAPGPQVPREPYAEWFIALEVAGSRQGLLRFLERAADLSHPWVTARFSFKAASPSDPKSPVRAGLSLETYLVR